MDDRTILLFILGYLAGPMIFMFLGAVVGGLLEVVRYLFGSSR